MVISFLAGVVGTGAGGLIVTFIKSPDDNLPGMMMGFSGGIMLSIVLFDMLPESMEAGMLVPAVAAIAGALILHIIHGVIPGHSHGHSHNHSHSHAKGGKKSTGNMRATGMMMIAGIALHNLPEGLAIGSGLASGPASMGNYGLELAILMTLHNIPEGIALAVPFSISGTRAGRLVMAAAVAGAPTVVGAGIGYLLGTLSEVFISACIAFAGGAMLYITIRELLPDAVGLSNYRMALPAIGAGVAVGLGMVLLVG